MKIASSWMFLSFVIAALFLITGKLITPFFFIRTPNFSPRLDVLIFSVFLASNVLIDVLKYLTIKIRYLYSITVYLLPNTIAFSLNYEIK